MSCHLQHHIVCCALLLLLNSSLAPGIAIGDEAAIGSITLTEVERRALIANVDVNAARLASDAAAADVITAGEAPNPQLSVSTTGNSFAHAVSSVVNWDNTIVGMIRIDQQIERGNKRALRVRAANSAVVAADSDVTDSLRSVRQQVDIAYFDLKYTQEAISVYHSLLDIQLQSLNAAQVQFKAGGISAADVARLRIEVTRSQVELTRAESALRAAQLSLALLMGTTTDSTQLHASDDWPPVITTQTDASADIEKRPDVMAAQARLQQAQQSLELARAQRARDIGVGLQYEHDLTGSNTPNAWTVGISVPLFLRSRYEGEIARAVADLAVAKESLHKISSNAALELQQAAAELNNATQRLNNYQGEILEQAGAAAEAAEYAYQRGASSLTDLLDARRVAQAINLDVLDAHNAYAKALADWRAVTTSSDAANIKQHPDVLK